MDINRNELLTELQNTPTKLEEQTRTLTDAELDFRPEADAWTIRENLAHLVNNEMLVMRTRLERMVKEELPDLALHNEQAWYEQRNTTRDSIDELLSDFSVQRAASLGIFAHLRTDDWKREALHAEYIRFDVDGWLEHWVGHDLAHLKQIEMNRATYAATSQNQ